MEIKEKILAYRLLEAFSKYEANIAISLGELSYTYKDLHAYSAKLSYLIMDKSSDHNTPVAILGGKSLHTYAGVRGALIASHAYMPLNLKYPPARNLNMLQQSGANIIIADSHSKEMLRQLLLEVEQEYFVIMEETSPSWIEEYPRHKFLSVVEVEATIPLIIENKPDDIAYLLFTSGTTGKPKGVPVSNLNVTAYLDHMLESWDFREDDRFSHTFDLTFDLSVHDIMLCWLSGACLCIPEEDTPFKLASYIRAQAVTVWFSVPSAAVLMNKMRLLKEDAFSSLRLSFFCGEALQESIADKWLEATGGNTVVNLYGPTEATIAFTSYTWNKQQRKCKNGIVCIGRAFTGQQHLLLEAGTLNKSENRGELCLGGTQVIKAYLNDEELSSKYLVSTEDDPERIWYRSGDLVEEDADGELFYLGRIDAEVKISGYRVNLLEVDAIIQEISGTSLLASVAEDKGSPRIITFIEKPCTTDGTQIIAQCKKELPWYMIPEVIIFVDEIPLNANGKIDRNMLKQALHEG